MFFATKIADVLIWRTPLRLSIFRIILRQWHSAI